MEQKDKKFINCKLVANHVVGEKDGKPYDFYSLTVRIGTVEVPLTFTKEQYQVRQLLTYLVVDSGE